MLRRAEDMAADIVVGMRGGKGSAEVLKLLKPEEFHDKGRLFAKITLKPGNSVGLHQHVGDCEAYYILSGEGTMNDNGQEIKVKSGDLIYCDEGQSHSIENTGSEDLLFIGLVLFA